MAVATKAMPPAENKMVAGVENKAGRCPICGGETITVVRHIGGYTPEQLAAHAVPPAVLPERAANPVPPEEDEARAAFYSAKEAADRANDAVAEAQRETVPGGLTYAHGFYEEQPRSWRSERSKEARVEGAQAALREALALQVEAEGAWRKLHDERMVRTTNWRDAQAAAARGAMVVKEKKTFASRLAAIIGR